MVDERPPPARRCEEGRDEAHRLPSAKPFEAHLPDASAPKTDNGWGGAERGSKGGALALSVAATPHDARHDHGSQNGDEQGQQ